MKRKKNMKEVKRERLRNEHKEKCKEKKKAKQTV